MNLFRKKILPKLAAYTEQSAARDEAKRCPFLKPLDVRNGLGRTVDTVEQECMRERCQIWDEVLQECSVKSAAILLRRETKNR